MVTDSKAQFHPVRNAFIILFIIISFVYSNNYYSSWHMDDYHAIIMNPQLQINELSPSTLFSTFFSQYGDKKNIYRPFSCLTFGLNWYIGGDDPFGYHVINNAIHILTSFFLFLFILKLFETPRLSDAHKGSDYFIALLSACFWAVNPLQTQAVTYIVQRMAQLSALFYIIGMLLFIWGRMAESGRSKFFFFAGCFLSFLMALASKENAATLPFSLLIIEIVFFKDYSNYDWRQKKKKYFLIAIPLLFIISILLVEFLSNSSYLIEQYEKRPFSLLQRLLTEQRILIFYLSQFFYPIPSRLSVAHDIELSTSFFHPWTTLPSVVLVLFLIILAIAVFRKQPLASLAILFYFLNHIIESSIIGLEAIFEHRNYLPSFFLFLPVAAGFKHLLNYYHKQNKYIYYLLLSFMIAVLTGIGIGAYTRNMAWATEKTLWEDAMIKAPQSARPPHNLAWGYYEPIGEYDKAFRLYHHSLNLYWPDKRHRGHAMFGMAGIYSKINEYEKAKEFYKKALKIDPDDEMSYNRLVSVLSKLEEWDEALIYINILISARPGNPDYLFSKGIILMQLNEYESAVMYFKKVLKHNTSSIKPLLNIGIALEMNGNYERAKWFYRLAHKKKPDDSRVLLLLTNINLKTNDDKRALDAIDKLLSLLNIKDMENTLLLMDEAYFKGLLSKDQIILAVSDRVKETSKEIENIIVLKKKEQ